MANAVYCIASDQSRAERIVNGLEAVGIPTSEMSVLFPDKSGTRDFAHTNQTKAPEGAATGATAGGVVGGALGLLAGIGLLAVPGIGPFVAAGPILAALSGAGLGGALGGIAGALVGMGIPEVEAKHYEGKVKEGNILISAHVEDNDLRAKAKKVMEDCGATDVHTWSTAKTPKSGKPAPTVHS
jgi:hypothetical protein